MRYQCRPLHHTQVTHPHLDLAYPCPAGASRPVSGVLSGPGPGRPSISEAGLPAPLAAYPGVPLGGRTVRAPCLALLRMKSSSQHGCPAAGELLPHLLTLTCARRPSAVILYDGLAGHPARELPGMLSCGAPTFLDRAHHRARTRSPGPLAILLCVRAPWVHITPAPMTSLFCGAQRRQGPMLRVISTCPSHAWGQTA